MGLTACVTVSEVMKGGVAVRCRRDWECGYERNYECKRVLACL